MSPRASIRRVSLKRVAQICFTFALVATTIGAVVRASAGNVYFVSPSGSDSGSGSLSQPFHTISRGMSRLRPGDTLFVRGGVYIERATPKITSGHSDAGILVAAYNAEKPVLQGSLSLSSPSYWTVRGLSVVAGAVNKPGKPLVRLRGGTHWTFADAEVAYGITTAGVLVDGSPSDFTLHGLYVHGMLPAGGGTADLVRIESGSHGTVERSVLAGSPAGAGVRVGSAGSNASVGTITLRYNTLYGNWGPANLVFGGTASASRVERNIMVSTGTPGSVAGAGLTGTQDVVSDNLAWMTTHVVQPGVAGLTDAGNNRVVDPRFLAPANSDFHTLLDLAKDYGAYAITVTPSPSPSPVTTVLPTVSPTPTITPKPTLPPPPPPPTVSPTPTPPPPVTVLTGRLYSSTSFWNTEIGSSPSIDPDSSAMVSGALAAYASNANFANTDSWGVPIVYADSSDKLYNVACTKYDCGTSISFRIPSGAKPTTGSDHHLVVVDGSKELDMWEAVYDSSNDSWSAGSRYVTDAYGWGAMCSLGQHCNGSVAAGFAAFGGIPRPEEFSGNLIPHALTITTPLTKSGFIACPATHTDGKSSSSGAIPEGARVQLDPSFDVAAQSWPQWKKVIARTLQVYGAYVSDTGGTLAIRGEADLNRSGAWSSAGVPEGASISDLPWAKMRVLTIKAC